ncbi:hypothetical protein D3C75_1307240 [compost metagenome]
MMGLVDAFKPLELRGEATVAGGVDHHQRLTGKTLTQVDLLLTAQFRQAALLFKQRRTVCGLR